MDSRHLCIFGALSPLKSKEKELGWFSEDAVNHGVSIVIIIMVIIWRGILFMKRQKSPIQAHNTGATNQ